MIVQLPALALAAGLMLITGTVLDLLQPWVIREEGVQPLRWSDRLLVNLLFFSLAPGALYAWFYPLVPFSGYRAGVFLALAFFLLAIAPTFAVYRLDVAQRPRATMGHLFWLFCKYLLVYGLLTAIYRP